MIRMGYRESQMLFPYIIDDRPKEVQAKFAGVIVVREGEVVSAWTKARIGPNQSLAQTQIAAGSQSMRCRTINRHLEEAEVWANFTIVPTEQVGYCGV